MTSLRAFAVGTALCVAVGIAAGQAFAHKVISSVYVSGDIIEGEIGLSNGEMAVGQKVIVTDGAGNPLGETTTDEDGFFVFKPAGPFTHVFTSNLGAGHVAKTELVAEDLALLSFADGAKRPVVAASSAASSAAPGASQTTADIKAIAAMIRAEVKPLRREIAAYKEKNDLQSILGGIGYILGLFGIGFYIMATRKKD